MNAAPADHDAAAEVLRRGVDMDMDPRPGYAMPNWETGFCDFRLVPDLRTLRTRPWPPATAVVICDACDDGGRLAEVAPRTILRRQTETGRAAGATFKFASELEFHLFRHSEDGALATIPGTLREAVEAFENSPLAGTALGTGVHTHLANFARRELLAFERETATDWERVRYFERV